MSMKKAELHVHLEGTIRPTLAKQLAKRNHITLPDHLFSEDGLSYTYAHFADFLKAYDAVAAVIKKPQDYYDLTFDYLRSNASENTIYTELSYSPDHAELSSGIPSSEHLQAIQAAINDAQAQFGIVTRLIIIAVRHFGVEAVTKAAQQTLKEDLPCITGFGLGGDEVNFPPLLFKKAYQIAAEGGLSCTIHAGEFGPAETMRMAINELPIKRIGHGVQAMHSQELQQMLKERSIALEICPSSNIALGLFKDFAAHPLPQFLSAGLQLSLNSDDPPFFRTSVGQEYTRVQKAYQYSDAQMLGFTEMALDAAFVDEETRKDLKKSLKESNLKL